MAPLADMAASIPTGIAAFSNSDMFKTPSHGKRKAKRWEYRLTAECLARQPSSLKQAAAHLKKPGLISLGGGLPSSQYFPFDSLEMKVPQVPFFGEEETRQKGLVSRIGKHDVAEGKDVFDLHTALNYGQSTGAPPMVKFITEHTEQIHNPPYDDWQCATSVGSTSSLEITYRMFVKPGDYIMTEFYTFSTAAECARPLGANWIGIDMDSQGLLPDHLDDVLCNWNPLERQNKSKPFLLYTVPSGHNPTGATQSLQRRQEIYRIAQKHDLYIIEDEPYFFLQMQPYTGRDMPDVPAPSSHREFLASLVPSYLSMDIDGRVIRLDSFAKVLGPGFRTGWITASAQIVERYTRHCESSVQNPAGISQLMLYNLLSKTWGHAGYIEWLIHLRMQYTKRRNNILEACEGYLPAEVASWTPPMAGMFHWIKIDWTKHADYGAKSLLEIEDEIYLAVIDKGALTSKGSWFQANAQAHAHDMFFRTTFAAAGDADVTEAVRRLGVALREVFHIST